MRHVSRDPGFILATRDKAGRVPERNRTIVLKASAAKGLEPLRTTDAPPRERVPEHRVNEITVGKVSRYETRTA